MARLGLAIAALIALAGCGGREPLGPATAASGPGIHLYAPANGLWTVRYELARPAREIVFARQPDDSRARFWRAEPGFEILAGPDGERVRRRDRLPFGRVALQVAPAYVDLPKDYAPFSRFGDGGLLAYTGRFFACAGSCPNDARWAMRVDAPGRAILVDGRRHIGTARWMDGGDGRNLYVGATRPVESADVIAVVDGALPTTLRTQLAAQLPAFMRYFAERFGALEQRPMLFASYDLSHMGGSGRQGGTLPGQVFVHYYGATWPKLMVRPDFADEQAWLFAHEAAHLFQRQVSGEGGDAWIHEGAADAFAALALQAGGADMRAYVERRLARMRDECPRDLGGASLREAVGGGRFEAAYSCGVLLSLALHKQLGGGDRGGLYALWRELVAVTLGDLETRYLALIRKAGGQRIAERVRAVVRDPKPDFTSLS